MMLRAFRLQKFAIEYERKTQNFNTFTANNMGGFKVSPQHSKVPKSIIKTDEASNNEKSLRIKSLKVKLPRPTPTKDQTKNKTQKTHVLENPNFKINTEKTRRLSSKFKLRKKGIVTKSISHWALHTTT